jgi:hypothetical protein
MKGLFLVRLDSSTHRFEVQINGKSSEEAETEIVNIVESIELTFAIQLPGADKTKFSWDLPFSGFTCD